MITFTKREKAYYPWWHYDVTFTDPLTVGEFSEDFLKKYEECSADILISQACGRLSSITYRQGKTQNTGPSDETLGEKILGVTCLAESNLEVCPYFKIDIEIDGPPSCIQRARERFFKEHPGEDISDPKWIDELRRLYMLEYHRLFPRHYKGVLRYEPL